MYNMDMYVATKRIVCMRYYCHTQRGTCDPYLSIPNVKHLGTRFLLEGEEIQYAH